MAALPVRWAVADKSGTHVGYVVAATKDEAIGKAQIKFGLSRHPYRVEVEES